MKYGIILVYHNDDGELCVDTVHTLCDTKEQAQNVIDANILDELETLQDYADCIDIHKYNYYRDGNAIFYGFYETDDLPIIEEFISQYFIIEFKEN